MAPGKSKKLLVRARVRKDLVAAFGQDAKIVRRPGHDYSWGIVVSPERVYDLFFGLVTTINYSNFKAEVGKKNPARARTYHDVWHALLKIENEEPRIQSSLETPCP